MSTLGATIFDVRVQGPLERSVRESCSGTVGLQTRSKGPGQGAPGEGIILFSSKENGNCFSEDYNFLTFHFGEVFLIAARMHRQAGAQQHPACSLTCTTTNSHNTHYVSD